MLWPLHRISLAKFNKGIGFRWTYSPGLVVICTLPVQCMVIDYMSPRKVICEPRLVHVGNFLISVSKIADMTIRLCLSKGRMCHTNVPDSKSYWSTIHRHDIIMPLTRKWEREIYIEDNIYHHNIVQPWHRCFRRNGQCAMQIRRNDHHHIPLILRSNYITLLSDPAHILNILEIAYGRSWKLGWCNWIRQNTQIDLYWWNIGIWIKMR